MLFTGIFRTAGMIGSNSYPALWSNNGVATFGVKIVKPTDIAQCTLISGPLDSSPTRGADKFSHKIQKRTSNGDHPKIAYELFISNS